MIKKQELNEIGLRFVLDALAPKTPWGLEEKRLLRPFAPGERAELDAAVGNVAAARRVNERAQLYAVLSRFREIRGTLRACPLRALSEVELFELKRFCLNVEALAACTQGFPLIAGFTLPDMAGPLAVLDPDGRRDPAFLVTDGELAALRREKRAAAPYSEAWDAFCLREQAAEERARARLTHGVLPFCEDMLLATNAVGALDIAFAKAELSERWGGSEPVFGGGTLLLTDCFHPAVANSLRDGFRPLSFRFERGASVLTGANMGGKSVAIQTVALNVTVALMGLYPFAREARIPCFSDLFYIAGSYSDSRSGLSDFAGQLAALLGALEAAEGDALILIDELARGTNPEEGAAIAMAVTERLNAGRAVSVVSTHYRGVAAFARTHYRAKGLKPNARADALEDAMDYGFSEAALSDAPPRDALTVCRLRGMDERLVARAEALLSE